MFSPERQVRGAKSLSNCTIYHDWPEMTVWSACGHALFAKLLRETDTWPLVASVIRVNWRLRPKE